ncbi:hypothetical protein WR25_03011 [Diploscapter pachys]|uniref:Receptor L-domain domain-containing protein n=1 Tax=Diploscapter pachys TaxID=2018661 RepID=A0A2A2LV41_9BILA|nr:hypothetical protein WR25_03011 [Diploscapter pachys]
MRMIELNSLAILGGLKEGLERREENACDNSRGDFRDVAEDCTVITGLVFITNMNDTGSTYEEMTKMLSNVEELPCFVVVAANYKDLAFLSKVTKITCEKDYFDAGVAGIVLQNENMERIGMPNIKEIVFNEKGGVTDGIFEAFNPKLCYDMSEIVYFSKLRWWYVLMGLRLCDQKGDACHNDEAGVWTDKDLPDNCEVVTGGIMLDEKSKNIGDEFKAKLVPIRLIYGVLYIQGAGIEELVFPNLEVFIGVAFVQPGFAIIECPNLSKISFPKISVIFDMFIDDASFLVLTNEKLSVSEATCDRWTSVGAVIRVEENAANCEGESDAQYSDVVQIEGVQTGSSSGSNSGSGSGDGMPVSASGDGPEDQNPQQETTSEVVDFKFKMFTFLVTLLVVVFSF